jgi:hypothetical protein
MELEKYHSLLASVLDVPLLVSTPNISYIWYGPAEDRVSIFFKVLLAISLKLTLRLSLREVFEYEKYSIVSRLYHILTLILIGGRSSKSKH